MPIDDGGPAFPVSTRPTEIVDGKPLYDTPYTRQDGPVTATYGGMTLQDYFASEAPLSEMALEDAYRQCLEKHLEGDDLLKAMADYVACWKFEVAAAMLRYRKAGA